MKPVPPPHSTSKPARPAAQPLAHPMMDGSQRSTVLLSLLLCPDGGVVAHRHGQGSSA